MCPSQTGHVGIRDKTNAGIGPPAYVIDYVLNS